ncbi:MAG: prepilin-type N-terminal cleavage/methylation domain-containing protein [Patescibacteria group bacterium]
MVNNNKKIVSGLADKAGFSLVEVLIAIFVLTFALLGTLSIIEAVTTAGRVSSTQLTAANLAQEGIELVRNFRDESIASSLTGSWDEWYDLFGVGATTCYSIQYNTATINFPASSISCASDAPALNYDSATGLYGSAGAPPPYSYKRKIRLTRVSTDEIKIEALMTWSEKGRSHSLTVEDRLWNWRSAN